MSELCPIFTVGHSNHEWGHFLNLLRSHGITALADVRSQPFSRTPHFSRDTLAPLLRSAGIKYVPLCQELGARRDEPDCYVDGQAVYDRVAQLPLFRQGIDRLLAGARDHTIALMCSEKEPLDCHRTILVCRHLRSYGLDIRHILADGRVEPHRLAEHRLMDLVGIASKQTNLFEPTEQLIEEAYDRRGREIAYRVPLQGTAP